MLLLLRLWILAYLSNSTNFAFCALYDKFLWNLLLTSTKIFEVSWWNDKRFSSWPSGKQLQTQFWGRKNLLWFLHVFSLERAEHCLHCPPSSSSAFQKQPSMYRHWVLSLKAILHLFNPSDDLQIPPTSTKPSDCHKQPFVPLHVFLLPIFKHSLLEGGELVGNTVGPPVDNIIGALVATQVHEESETK